AQVVEEAVGETGSMNTGASTARQGADPTFDQRRRHRLWGVNGLGVQKTVEVSQGDLLVLVVFTQRPLQVDVRPQVSSQGPGRWRRQPKGLECRFTIFRLQRPNQATPAPTTVAGTVLR